MGTRGKHAAGRCAGRERRPTPAGRRWTTASLPWHRRGIAVVISALVAVPIVFAGGSSANSVRAAGPDQVVNQQPAGAWPVTPDPSLGATGVLPRDVVLSAELARAAGNPAALRDGADPVGDLPRGQVAIPGIVLDAYQRAERVLADDGSGCQVPWWLLAGIGKVESNQAGNGDVDERGNTLRPMLGPELDGDHGFAAIPATDDGTWSGGGTWARARGPMQFLAASWRVFGGGGNPNNVYDAALAAGRYLCAGAGDLSDPARRALAVFSYNHSNDYVRIVLIWANAYRTGITPVPGSPVPVRPPAAPKIAPLPPAVPHAGPPPSPARSTTGPSTGSAATTPAAPPTTSARSAPPSPTSGCPSSASDGSRRDSRRS